MFRQRRWSPWKLQSHAHTLRITSPTFYSLLGITNLDVSSEGQSHIQCRQTCQHYRFHNTGPLVSSPTTLPQIRVLKGVSGGWQGRGRHTFKYLKTKFMTCWEAKWCKNTSSNLKKLQKTLRHKRKQLENESLKWNSKFTTGKKKNPRYLVIGFFQIENNKNNILYLHLQIFLRSECSYLPKVFYSWRETPHPLLPRLWYNLLWVVTSDITEIGIDCIKYYTDQKWPFKTDENKIEIFFQWSTIT